MIWTKNKSTRSLVFVIAVLGLATAGLWFGAQSNTTKANTNNLTLASAPAATFGGSGFGNIPSPPSGNCWGAFVPTPINVTFNVSGLSGTPTNVEVNHDITHSWVGDVRATLIAPNAASHILYSRTGATTSTASGDSSNLLGSYNIKDSAVGTNWWTAALNADGATPIPMGDYRSTTPGGGAGGGVDTNITPSFASVTNPNGTWTLRVEDGCAGDTGAINAATLTIDSGPAVPADPPIDFDGDGKSDFSTVRNNTPPPSGQEQAANSARRSINELQNNPGFKPFQPAVSSVAPENHGTNLGWYIANSGSGTSRVQNFGQPTTDTWVPEDFDGDGKDDLAVWRGVAATGPNGGFFYTYTSSNNTVNEINFGQIGDNARVVGDYDGDGKADPAVFRCPPNPGGQCTFFYRGSLNNPGGNITYVPWGNNSSSNVRPYPGDFDGDGKYDFCVFQNGLYILRRTSDNGVEWINWGLPTDAVLAPGDYDGDGKTDFMNVRVSGNNVQWWLLNRNGGQSTTTWGAVGIAGFSEFAAQSDFDGDGKMDIAIWRRNNGGPSGSFFYVLRSSTQSLQTFEWGSSGDAPVPGWNGN